MAGLRVGGIVRIYSLRPCQISVLLPMGMNIDLPALALEHQWLQVLSPRIPLLQELGIVVRTRIQLCDTLVKPIDTLYVLKPQVHI